MAIISYYLIIFILVGCVVSDLSTPNGCEKLGCDKKGYGEQTYYYIECDFKDSGGSEYISGTCSNTINKEYNCGYYFDDSNNTPISYNHIECDHKKCESPDGINCYFYTDCVDDFYDCEFNAIATNKCEQYLNNENKMSQSGEEWSKYVRACLQTKLADVLFDKKLSTCSKGENVFFSEHLACYLDGPVSFCDLSVSDQVLIMYIASDMIFTENIMNVYDTGMKLMSACHAYFVLFIKISYNIPLKRSRDNIDFLDGIVDVYYVDDIINDGMHHQYYILYSETNEIENITSAVKKHIKYIQDNGEDDNMFVVKNLMESGKCDFFGSGDRSDTDMLSQTISNCIVSEAGYSCAHILLLVIILLN